MQRRTLFAWALLSVVPASCLGLQHALAYWPAAPEDLPFLQSLAWQSHPACWPTHTPRAWVRCPCKSSEDCANDLLCTCVTQIPHVEQFVQSFQTDITWGRCYAMGSPLCALYGGTAFAAGDANMDHLVNYNCQPVLTHSWTEDDSRTRAKHSSKDQDEMGWLVVNRPQDLYTELLFGNLSAHQKVLITVDLYLTSDCQIDQRFLRTVATHSSSNPLEISTGHLTTAISRAWILAFLRDITLCVLMYLAAVIAILTGPLNGTTSPCFNLHDLHSNFRLCQNHILTWPQSSLISKWKACSLLGQVVAIEWLVLSLAGSVPS